MELHKMRTLPLDTTWITAELPLAACFPLRPKILSAVWADLLRPSSSMALFQNLLLVVVLSVLVTAKTPPATWVALVLIYNISTLWTDIARLFCV